MIALVLVHEGLDVSIDLDLREPGPGRGGTVGHRGGDRLVVTARADRAALEWALTLADRVAVVTVGPPAVGGRARVGARPGRRPGGEDLGRRPGRARPRVDGADRLRGRPADRSGRRGRRRARSRRRHRRPAGARGRAPRLAERRRRHPACPRGGRARRRAAPSGRPPGGARRPVPGRRHRGRGLRRAALRVDPGPAGGGAARPRDLVAGGPRVSRRAPFARRCGSAWTAWTGRGRGHAGPPRRPRPAPLARPPTVSASSSAAGAPAPDRGAPAAPPASGLVEGDPRAVADRIMAFLEQRGFV